MSGMRIGMKRKISVLVAIVLVVAGVILVWSKRPRQPGPGQRLRDVAATVPVRTLPSSGAHIADVTCTYLDEIGMLSLYGNIRNTSDVALDGIVIHVNCYGGIPESIVIRDWTTEKYSPGSSFGTGSNSLTPGEATSFRLHINNCPLPKRCEVWATQGSP